MQFSLFLQRFFVHPMLGPQPFSVLVVGLIDGFLMVLSLVEVSLDANPDLAED